MHHTPPHDIELERAIIGAIMINKDAVYTALGIIDKESFYDPKNQHVLSAIISLYDKSKPIDILTVVNELKTLGMLNDVGGVLEVSKYTDGVSSVAHLETHCRIVQEKYMKRRQAKLAHELTSMAYDETADPFSTDEFITREQLDISKKVIKGAAVKSIKDITPKVVQAVAAASTQKGMTGITTGIFYVDKIYGGRQDSDLIIKAGRPGMGKTASALCEALAAAKSGRSVAFFSCEMSELQLVNRLASIQSGVDLRRIQRGGMNEDEMNEFNVAIGLLERLPIRIIDKAGINLRELATICMRLKQQNQLDIIFIDYLQLITVSELNKNSNREQEISLISRTLKGIAKTLNVPVIALSQLNRSVESRGGEKKPNLSDLRESGAIEQDADIVEFLYRPEYYGITQDEDGNPTAGVGYLLIEKHRNGSTGPVKMKWIGHLTKYDNFGYGYEPQPLPKGDFDEAPF